jgi:hypothetical protein
MRGNDLAQLNVLTRMSKVQEMEPRASHQVFIDVPLHKEPLGKFRGRQTRLSLTRQTSCPRLSPHRMPRVHACSNFNDHMPNRWTRPSLTIMVQSRRRTLSRELPKLSFTGQTRLSQRRWTLPSVCCERA